MNGSQEGTGMLDGDTSQLTTEISPTSCEWKSGGYRYVCEMVILDHYNRDFPVGSRSRQGTGM